jgi:L-threonylcarbamoyladenylate synthase
LLISLDDAVARLQRGDIVALPTETVYGLAGIALCSKTVHKIYSLKGRPTNNPLIVHVSSTEHAEELAEFNDLARKVCDAFWPGALTIVLPKKQCVPSEITAGGNTVALRSPAHPLFREVLDLVKQPLAAPSANPSNRTSPTEAAHVLELFGENAPPVLDGGPCRLGMESTVLDLSVSHPRILRYGPVKPEEIEDILARKVELPNGQEPGDKAMQKSPGTSSIHYAPNTPLLLCENIHDVKACNPSDTDWFIFPQKTDLPQEMMGFIDRIFFLSANGKAEEIAQNLYKVLIEADKKGASRLIALLPNQKNDQLYLAIRDRMNRAGKGQSNG